MERGRVYNCRAMLSKKEAKMLAEKLRTKIVFVTLKGL